MRKYIQKDFELLARMIKAMAHPTRLFIIDELSREKRCVCELKDMIGADISTVSKHLSLLREAGMVEDEKQGTKVIYSLRTPCVLKFLGCLETVILQRSGQKAAKVC